MTMDNDQAYYQRRAEQQLSIAGAAADPSIKAIHLDLAARYATLGELAARNGTKDAPGITMPMQVAIGR